MHLDDGALRALLDKPGHVPENAAAARHLAGCAECRARADEFAARSERIASQFAALESRTASNPQAALSRFYARYDRRKENSMLKTVFARRLRPVWAFAAIVVLLIGSMSLEPVRAFAGQFLGLFRVQNIQVITVDPTLLDQLTTNNALGQQIGNLLSTSVNVTKKPEKPQSAKDAAQASQLAGFQVRLPSNRQDLSQLMVTGGSAFQFTVNRQRAQEILNQAGRSDLQLPASVDGATIKVNIPNGISAGYGNCPQLATSDGPVGRGPGAAPGPVSGTRGTANCVVLVEIPSPTVDTPPDLNVQQLAEFGLEFTGMSAQQAHSFAQTVDWTSTLVVPIPRNAANYQQVNVDGANGYLIQRSVEDAPEYALIWAKNGIIYTIGGQGPNSSAAIQMANSLH